ncbi:MAG: lytic transglycosylase domain-containing protein [Ruthenibacterium sp.]
MKHRRGMTLALTALCLAGLLCLYMAGKTFAKAAYPLKYNEMITRYAAEYALDPLLIDAFIRTESGFKPQAVSDANARGLMQMTEETFLWVKSKIAAEEAIAFDALDEPEVSVRFGAYLLSFCMQRYDGNLQTAAAAYHSGVGLVDGLLKDEQYSADGKTLHTFPYRQMNHYVRKIAHNYERYQKIYQDKTKGA